MAIRENSLVRQAFRSRRVVLPEGVRPATVIVEGSVIRDILPIDEHPEVEHVTDVSDQYLLPGLIDVHAHINEPGRTEWEGFETGTRAAAAGGFTCVIDMPLNCIPSTTTFQALEQKRASAAGKCMVDYAFWGGAVEGNSSEFAALAQAGVKGFKCFLVHPGTDEFQMVKESDLREAMPVIADLRLPLLAHAELPGPLVEATQALEAEGASWRDYKTYLRSRPEQSEVEAIRLLIQLCREYRCPVHIVHLSAASALPDLREARREGLPITVETCPHYLSFQAEEIPSGATQYKCAPPIRSGANRERLWQALLDGDIDLVGTDHSPCPPELKCFREGNFRTAWGGISSLSVALPAMWTAAQSRGIPFEQIVRWMATRPAELAGMQRRKGRIARGLDADLVVFDDEASFTVTAEDLHFRHACSPYLDRQLLGRVSMTFVRGHLAYDRPAFSTHPNGTEVQA